MIWEILDIRDSENDLWFNDSQHIIWTNADNKEHVEMKLLTNTLRLLYKSYSWNDAFNLSVTLPVLQLFETKMQRTFHILARF